MNDDILEGCTSIQFQVELDAFCLPRIVAPVKACLSYEVGPTPEFVSLSLRSTRFVSDELYETKTVPRHSVHLIIIPCNSAAYCKDQSLPFHSPAAADYLDHQ